MNTTADPIQYRLRLKWGREKSVRLGHPWVFSGAVEEVETLSAAESGGLGDVVDASGNFLARGTVQPDSQIVCRILTWKEEPIDRAFFERRIDAALALRQEFADSRRINAYRLINSEGDEIPGLVVDLYHQFLVTQTLTEGMRNLRDLWLDPLVERLQPLAVLERGDRARREPVADEDGPVLRGLLPDGPARIVENGLQFLVDLQDGQKTGFYLDQRPSRLQLGGLAEDNEVLNLFGYTGAFSVYAGDGGARRVVHVESSKTACELVQENWKLNGLETAKLELLNEDAFEYVRHCEQTFDQIVLDPPPLARSKGALDSALRAYKDLHMHAFCIARPGARIFTFTCSQHVSTDLFQKVVFGAARDVGASVQWLDRLGPGIDHPVHLNHPQGEYLKGLHLRVLTPGTRPTKPPGEDHRADRPGRAGESRDRDARPERDKNRRGQPRRGRRRPQS